MSRAKGFYFETELFDSSAYNSLTKAEMRIYGEFLLKRQFGKSSKKSHDKVIKNNGLIIFTYREAEKRGFPRPTFRKAIDKLINVGLVDITKQGYGGINLHGKITGEPNLFAISERWKQYQTPTFIKTERKSDTRKGRGWSVFHAKRKGIYG